MQRKLADLSLSIRRSAPNQIPLGQVNQLFPANVDEEIELYKRFEPESDGGHIQYALAVIRGRCGGSQPLFSSSSTVQELIITRTRLCQGSQRMPDTGLGRMSTDTLSCNQGQSSYLHQPYIMASFSCTEFQVMPGQLVCQQSTNVLEASLR
jgi:hypothetical protein